MIKNKYKDKFKKLINIINVKLMIVISKILNVIIVIVIKLNIV